MLNSREVNAARDTLGRLWGMGRALSCAELGRCLELANPKDSGRAMCQRDGSVSGPVSVAVCAMLAGYIPDGAPPEAWEARRLKWVAERNPERIG